MGWSPGHLKKSLGEEIGRREGGFESPSGSRQPGVASRPNPPPLSSSGGGGDRWYCRESEAAGRVTPAPRAGVRGWVRVWTGDVPRGVVSGNLSKPE